jgi:hypothetical protein
MFSIYRRSGSRFSNGVFREKTFKVQKNGIRPAAGRRRIRGKEVREQKLAAEGTGRL